jgi:hypothetical protein
MARKMTEWPSKRGPIAKIMPSDGCEGGTVPLPVGQWYDFHEFGCHLGNVGSTEDPFTKNFEPHRSMFGKPRVSPLDHKPLPPKFSAAKFM